MFTPDPVEILEYAGPHILFILAYLLRSFTRFIIINDGKATNSADSNILFYFEVGYFYFLLLFEDKHRCK